MFKPPTHLGPSILRYGIMTLTQCKQVCIGGNHTYAILGNDTCWCGNQTDVDLLVPDVSGTIDRVINSSQIYCPGNQLQRCPANRDTVDVYSIGITLFFFFRHDELLQLLYFSKLKQNSKLRNF